jgi:phage-related holin
MRYFLDSLAAIAAAFLTFLFGIDGFRLIPAIILLQIVDHVTGILAALRNKEPIVSSKLKNFFFKLAVYAGAIIGVNQLSAFAYGDTAEALVLFAKGIPLYIGLTEFKSIVENCARAGFPIPGIQGLNDLLSVIRKK